MSEHEENILGDADTEGQAVSVNRPAAARNWTEDFTHENGQYMNRCEACGETFVGHKRRVRCKACLPPAPAVPTREVSKPIRWSTDDIRLMERQIIGCLSGRHPDSDEAETNVRRLANALAAERQRADAARLERLQDAINEIGQDDDYSGGTP